jgi:hypothetical protein
MDEIELTERVNRVLGELRAWANASRRNLDRFIDVFHEGDEGKKHQAVLDIVVGKLGLTPEDAAVAMVAMKEAWVRGQEALEGLAEDELVEFDA